MCETVELKIVDVGFGGDGIGRWEGLVVFVPFTLTGETVEVKITQRKKGYARAELLRVIDPAPGRTTPVCSWYGRCGGCCYQHADYECQLAMKHKQVTDVLQRLGHIDAPAVAPVVAAPQPFAYRNKVTLHGPGTPGYVALDNTTILPIEECPLAAEPINKEIARLHNEQVQIGDNLVIRCAGPDRVWSYAESSRPSARQSRKKHPAVKESSMTDQSFQQVNEKVSELLVQHMRKTFAQTGCSYLIDAYCGSGLFALRLADLYEGCSGIETDSKAVVAARRKVEELQLPATKFLNGTTDDMLPAALRKAPPAATCLILDPPRKGCRQRVLEIIAEKHPEYVVYISCNPPVLARDLAKLCGAGYEPVEIVPFDMFPQTAY